MQLTLGQAISRATTLAAGRLDWDASDASFYVNQSVAYVARNIAVEHKSLESSYATTIASGVTRMLLPADYDDCVALSIGSTIAGSASTSWRQLGKKDIGWADNFANRLDATAGKRPEAYVEFGATHFEIIPAASSSLSLMLRYHTIPSERTLSTDTLPLNERWHWPAVLKAAELLAMSRSDVEMEQLNRNRYIDYMSTVMPDQDKKWMDQRGSQVPLPRARSDMSARI